MQNWFSRRGAANGPSAPAPPPNGSAATYGFVAAVLMLVASFLAGGFFRIDATSNTPLLLGLTIFAFAAGVFLRMWRQRAHTRSLHVSPKGQPRDAPPDPDDDPLVSSQQRVTFAAAFLLPGLDLPHPPGTFELRVRREPLDVSWPAYVETRTILLTGNGRIEALDVKAGDLERALRLDAAASGANSVV